MMIPDIPNDSLYIITFFYCTNKCYPAKNKNFYDVEKKKGREKEKGKKNKKDIRRLEEGERKCALERHLA